MPYDARLLIVQDYEGRWFLRQVAFNRQDDIANEMVYHCDQHLGGPYESLAEVPAVANIIEQCAKLAAKKDTANAK